jgi:hypothetical protein
MPILTLSCPLIKKEILHELYHKSHARRGRGGQAWEILFPLPTSHLRPRPVLSSEARPPASHSHSTQTETR